jgi:hypothetical protein
VKAVVVNEEDFNECDKDEAALTLRRRTVTARRPMYVAGTKASLRSISQSSRSVCATGPFLWHGGGPFARAAAQS